MSKLDSTFQIRSSACHIQSKLINSNAEEIKAAMKEYTELVDRFYNENKEFMAPQQYNAAKKDLEYFMSLVELALAHHRQKICEGKV